MNTRNEMIKRFADELYESLYSAKAIEPLSTRQSDITIDEAYAIQMLNVQKELDKGKIITGKKIGLTSKAMQNLFSVDQPDYGHLFNDMEVEFDGMIQMADLIAPRVEAEIAFKLNRGLSGSNLTVEEVLDASESVVASLEIVDSRVQDWKIKIWDTVSDNASSCRYVLGKTWLDPKKVDLKAIQMSFYRNGELVNEGKGSDALGDPAFCVAWLGNRLSQYNVQLNAGEVILSGALSAAVPAQKGDRFEAKFSELGSVSVSFG